MIELELIVRGEVLKPKLGPWRATQSDAINDIWHIDDKGGSCGNVATVWGINNDPRATALLIAAAPDMLDALQAILKYDGPLERKIARAAIRKATSND